MNKKDKLHVVLQTFFYCYCGCFEEEGGVWASNEHDSDESTAISAAMSKRESPLGDGVCAPLQRMGHACPLCPLEGKTLHACGHNRVCSAGQETNSKDRRTRSTQCSHTLINTFFSCYVRMLSPTIVPPEHLQSRPWFARLLSERPFLGLAKSMSR